RMRYSAASLARRLEGEVLLRMTVSEEGRVTGVTILVSSGHGALDFEAMNLARQWRFGPAPRDWSLRVPFDYTLKGR
ncbi:MAG: energy transducer TonB, partial [Planctomycetales bacterium]